MTDEQTRAAFDHATHKKDCTCGGSHFDQKKHDSFLAGMSHERQRASQAQHATGHATGHASSHVDSKSQAVSMEFSVTDFNEWYRTNSDDDSPSAAAQWQHERTARAFTARIQELEARIARLKLDEAHDESRIETLKYVCDEAQARIKRLEEMHVSSADRLGDYHDRCVALEQQRDEALAKVAELEGKLADALK